MSYWQSIKQEYILLTHKQLETHGYVLRTVVTDALVQKQQAINTHNAG